MTETGWWILLSLALALLCFSAVRTDVWAAWLHERFDPWLQRIRHH
ncbi:hypothetical protein [Ideonella sp. BN130291]|nr:hypothetical protein [Ideonella sp. BN130291]